MRARVLIAICVLLATTSVAQSRRWFAPEVSCWITQEKVPATWEDAQRRCERHGEPLSDVYHKWYVGYPLVDARNTCVNFYALNKRLINDCTCDYKLYFTCERAQ